METAFKQEPYLYKLSAIYRDDYVPGFEPTPTSASELPDIEVFASSFAQSVLEIWAGKRSASQLSKYCHHEVFQQLLTSMFFVKTKMMSWYLQQKLHLLPLIKKAIKLLLRKKHE